MRQNRRAGLLGGKLKITYTGVCIDQIVTMSDGEFRLLTLTSSGKLTVNKSVTAEVWLCGGGSKGRDFNGLYGGAGAYCASKSLNLTSSITAVVGAAGGNSSIGDLTAYGVTESQNGGTGGGGTVFKYGKGDGISKHPFGDTAFFTNIPCAAGGAGGTYVPDTVSDGYLNYGGAGGSNGENGSEGGQGYGSNGSNISGGAGGFTGGGKGGTYARNNAGAATYYGSGGGGSGKYAAPAGTGYQGVIFIRIPV